MDPNAISQNSRILDLLEQLNTAVAALADARRWRNKMIDEFKRTGVKSDPEFFHTVSQQTRDMAGLVAALQTGLAALGRSVPEKALAETIVDMQLHGLDKGGAQ